MQTWDTQTLRQSNITTKFSIKQSTKQKLKEIGECARNRIFILLTNKGGNLEPYLLPGFHMSFTYCNDFCKYCISLLYSGYQLFFWLFIISFSEIFLSYVSECIIFYIGYFSDNFRRKIFKPIFFRIDNLFFFQNIKKNQKFQIPLVIIP